MYRSHPQTAEYAAIAIVDRLIDAVQADLQKRDRFDDMTAAGWQKAWDRHPILHLRHKQLFHRRGFLQIERDARRNAAWAKHQRAEAGARTRALKVAA